MDLETQSFVTEFTVDDEAILEYCVVDDLLVIPGADATEEWDWGNVYVRMENKWVKHRTVPWGLHVFDAVSFDGSWFLGSGSIFKLTDDSMNAFGGVFISEDQGESWQLVYSTPTDFLSVYRIRSIVQFRDHLCAFFYAYTGMRKEDVPGEYHEYLGPSYDGEYLFFSEDAMGPVDMLMFDGRRRFYQDILPVDKRFKLIPDFPWFGIHSCLMTSSIF